jgi:hypothetical protein
MVTAGSTGGPYPYNAVYAWEPFADTDPSYWDTRVDYNFCANGADWIWESYRVVHPVDGDIVYFERIFEIPCCCCPGLPLNGTLHITCDNGYEVYLNGHFVGSAQLNPGWGPGSLTEDYVTSGFFTVEHYNVSEYLQPAENNLTIIGVNEYMAPDDYGEDWGTVDNNPGGLIFELEIATVETDMTLVSCDIHGSEKDTFSIAEDVYVKGSDFPASQDVDIYVIPNGADPTPGSAMTLPPATVTTLSDGTLPKTLVWSAPLTLGEYDVWVDMNQNGEYECYYDAYFDACRVYSFHVIPEYLFGSIGAILAMFGSYTFFRLKQKHRNSKM